MDYAIMLLIGACLGFQVSWIAGNWDFFRPGGEINRGIYSSEIAKRLRRWRK